jgi:hypothetical protein
MFALFIGQVFEFLWKEVNSIFAEAMLWKISKKVDGRKKGGRRASDGVYVNEPLSSRL